MRYAFKRDAHGYWAAPTTEKAIEFAQGDPHRLAAASLAGFLTERGIPFIWERDVDPCRFHDVGGYFDIIATACEPDGLGKFEAEDWTDEQWAWRFYVATNVKDIVVLIGAAWQSGSIGPRELLSVNEWLLGVGELKREMEHPSERAKDPWAA